MIDNLPDTCLGLCDAVIPHVHYSIPGRPIALKRHRHAKGRTYDPQAMIKKQYQYYLLPRNILEPPYLLQLHFKFKLPTSWSKKKKEQMIHTPHTSTPDLSNLIKFVEDASNGILFPDDRYIAQIIAHKTYEEEDETLITLYSV